MLDELGNVVKDNFIIKDLKEAEKVAASIYLELYRDAQGYKDLVERQKQAIAIWGKPYEELTTEQQERILNVNKLLEQRKKLEGELEEFRKPCMG